MESLLPAEGAKPAASRRSHPVQGFKARTFVPGILPMNRRIVLPASRRKITFHMTAKLDSGNSPHLPPGLLGHALIRRISK